MSDRLELLIIGGGLAGLFGGARGYRDAGGHGPVAIVADEHRMPYSRPPLTKALLRGESDEGELPLEREQWLVEQGVALISGRAVALDAEPHEVVLSGGRRLRYGHCVLATGAEPTRLPVPGADDPGVRVVRALDHVRELLARLPATGAAVAVIGSGFIGCEIASSLRRRGAEVTLISDEQAPNQARLGSAAATEISGWLRDEGVRLELGAEVESIRRDRQLHVKTRNVTVTADVVVMATGVSPRGELLAPSGTPLVHGAVPTDASMRTALAGVLAAGDVCIAENTAAGRPLRVEHWGDALTQGELAGRSAAGAPAQWDQVPGFWSTIGDNTLKYAAWGDGYHESRHERHADGGFTTWYGRDGRIVGVLAHRADHDYEHGQRLIAEGRAVVVDALVVIPARDERERIGDCLRALAAQTVAPRDFATIVVLDRCSDDTAEVLAGAAAELGLEITALEGPGKGAGAARRVGMDAACARFLRAGRPDGLIACTDADSRPAPDWLARQLEYVRAGARAIAGLIELDDQEARGLPAGVLRRREREAERRLRQVRSRDRDAGHHHSAGASLAVTAEAYRQVGGIEPLPALEDASFADRLARHGVPLLRPVDVRVRTSARAAGRVARGLSVDLAVASWLERRRYRAAEFTIDQLLSCKDRECVSVIVPAKECAQTIAGVLQRTAQPLLEAGLVDELLVVDAASADGTAVVAARCGARVLQQDELEPELGPALGKGDAMWRALRHAGGNIICFLDADTGDPHPDHLLGLLGPILSDDSIVLVKGAFERPLDTGAGKIPDEGGRVTELMARPLLNMYAPLLAGISQPLAGEVAARRELLHALRFPVGYGVEIAMLIDTLRLCGLDALAECHLGTRQNRHQPLRALGEMAYAVLAAAERRLPDMPRATPDRYMRPWEDGATVAVPIAERPPVDPSGLSRWKRFVTAA